MRITVIAPDRLIAVDGLHVTFTDAAPDEAVSTLQYDTAAGEGVITYADMRSEGFRDPALVKPWVALWSESLAEMSRRASDGMTQADAAFAEWQAQDAERARVAEEQARAREAEVAKAETAAAGVSDRDAELEAKVRAVIAEMAKAQD